MSSAGLRVKRVAAPYFRRRSGHRHVDSRHLVVGSEHATLEEDARVRGARHALFPVERKIALLACQARFSVF